MKICDYKYLLFDLDGTLTDPEEGITRCVQYALEYFGIEEGDRSKLRCFIGPPLVDSFREFYGMDKEQAVRATEKYRERFENVGLFENEPYTGIREMLALLKERGKVLAVATSKPEFFAKRILEHFCLSEYFNVICGAPHDLNIHSTKADVILQALNELGIAEGEEKRAALMIGDRKHDLIGAKEAGIDCLGVEFGFAEEGELERYGADYIVGTVKELEEALLGR